MLQHIYLTLILVTYITISHGYQVPAKTHRKENIEDRVLNSISTLPEVKQFMRTTPSPYKPALLLNGTPNSTSKYYWVKVGISDADIFRTNYNFLIDPKTFQILFMDTMCDSGNCNITLVQWRHWRKTPGFNKIHVYKHGKLVALTS